MNKIIDLTEAIAKTITTCDACGKSLGGRYLDKAHAMGMYLDDGEDSYGNTMKKEFHTCGEDCSRDLLNKRAEKKAKKS